MTYSLIVNTKSVTSGYLCSNLK